MIYIGFWGMYYSIMNTIFQLVLFFVDLCYDDVRKSYKPWLMNVTMMSWKLQCALTMRVMLSVFMLHFCAVAQLRCTGSAITIIIIIT